MSVINIRWYSNTSFNVIQLLLGQTPRLIRKTFWIVTKKELPSKTNDICAIFSGGRERAIFVKFKTDSQGIEYILKTFDGPDVELKVIDESFLHLLTESNVSLLPHITFWQKKLNLCFYNQKSIKFCRLLHDAGRPGNRPGYRILLDDQECIVYIEGWSY